MSDRKSVLIIGANRGLGLEWVRQWLERDARVFATARRPANADELQRLQKRYRDALSIHQTDVRSGESVEALTRELEGRKLDVLIYNAGIRGSSGVNSLDPDEVSTVLDTNSVGAIRVVKAFRSNLSEGDERGKIALITSLMGSIDDNRSGGSYGYRMSKAALNMAGRSMAVDFQNEGIDVILLHPGWVETDMGGPNARIGVEESVTGMMSILDRLNPEMSGTFWHSNGNELPW